MQPIGPDTPHGSGATAIVSMSTVTPSVHVMVVFAGLVSSNANSRDKSENSFTLRLQFIDSGAVVIEEVRNSVSTTKFYLLFIKICALKEKIARITSGKRRLLSDVLIYLIDNYC